MMVKQVYSYDIDQYPCVTYSELIENPEAYHDTIVSVEGFYILNGSASTLFSSKEAAKDIKSPAIWVGGDARWANPDWINRKDKSRVRLIGRFMNESLGIFDQYQGQFKDVLYMEILD